MIGKRSSGGGCRTSLSGTADRSRPPPNPAILINDYVSTETALPATPLQSAAGPARARPGGVDHCLGAGVDALGIRPNFLGPADAGASGSDGATPADVRG